jgi:hypothetical protein
MAKFTDTKDPEIERLVNQLVTNTGQQDMGIKAFDSPPPSYMGDDHAGAGTEGIGGATEMPRLDLMQALSPQVQEGNARPGDWYHTSAEENLGKEVLFVVCNSTRSAILWRPRPAGGRLAVTTDMRSWNPSNAVFDDVVLSGGKTVTWETKGTVAESGLLEWGSLDPNNREAGGFAATEYVNILAFFPEHPTLFPAVISAFKRSGLKVGRRLNTQLLALKGRGKPVYAGLFRLSSKRKEGPNGPYLIPHFEGIGWCSESDYRTGKRIWEESHDLDLTQAASEAEPVDPVAAGHEDAGDY